MTGIPEEYYGWWRIIEECERHGIEPPTFEDRAGAMFVTFWAQILPGAEATPQVTPQVVGILKAAGTPCSRAQLQQAAGLKDRDHFRKAHLDPLLQSGWLEMTIPDKPRSSQQRYRLTKAGKNALKKKS